MTIALPPPLPSSAPPGPTTLVNANDHTTATDRPRPVGRLTRDDWSSVVASFFGSLGLVWLLYFQILPLSGKVGFLICWYAGFLLIYGLVSSVNNPRPVVVDRMASAAVAGAAGVVIFAVFSVALYTFIKGWAAYTHPGFYTHDMAGIGPTDPLTDGGIDHAIVGSLIELAIATAVALPLGIGTAVYMVEIGGRFSRIVRTVVESMTALPDILAGLFIYDVLLLHLGIQRNGFCAAMSLSIMMLPIIARSADVQLRVVPGGLREASYALGSTRWSTVIRVVLPTARSGLATAVILGLARAIGETAPVLITSGASTFFNDNPLHNPMNSLPLFIITAVRSGEPTFITRGFGAASVLLFLVVVLFVAARVLSREKTKR